MTFSGTAEMPGLTLQPGTYVFKLADTPSRNVVQVFDKDEKKVLGQWLFVPASRRDVSEDTIVMFRETPAGTTPAVQYWYYPGDRIGKEFVYPKDQATRIARATNQNVLVTEGANTPESSVSSIDAQGKVTEWKPEPAQPAASAQNGVGVVNGAGIEQSQPSARARVSEQPVARVQEQPTARVQEPSAAPVQEQPTQLARADRLPETASPLALAGLLGLLSLAAAATVRFVRQ